MITRGDQPVHNAALTMGFFLCTLVAAIGNINVYMFMPSLMRVHENGDFPHNTDIEELSCRAAAAGVAADRVHWEYFLLQQAAELQFADSTSSALCNGTISEQQFQQKLFDLMKPMRAAINRHTHAAFFVKSACGWTMLHAPVAHNNNMYRGVFNEARFCTPIILKHEPFNLMESSNVINLTNGLIKRGLDFCNMKKNDRYRVIYSDHNRLAHNMMGHKFAKFGFDSIVTTLNESCRKRAVGKAEVDSIMERIREQVDRGCSFHPSDMTAEVHHLARAFANDTLLTLDLAKIMLQEESRSCPVSRSLHLRSLAQLRPPSDRARRFFEWHLTSGKPAYFFGILTRLMLATVYHKLVPICSEFSADRDLPRYDEVCEEGYWHPLVAANAGIYGAGNPDMFPVMDLVTSSNSSRCSGSSCRRAAQAVDAYQRVLQLLTPFRNKMIDAFMRYHPDERDVQHCMVDAPFPHTEFIDIQNALDSAAKLINENAHQMDVVCVGPARTPFF